MPRLTASELDKLKRSVSLLALLQAEGYVLKKQGKDYLMCCPFHQEKSASFSVSVVKNCYHCFGCDASGSVLDYVMQSQRLTMGKAIVYLQQQTGNTVQKPAKNPSLSTPSLAASCTESMDTSGAEPDAALLHSIEGQRLLHRAVDYYHHQLLNSPEALAWLEQRGLTHPELLSTFKLGYAGTYGVSVMAGSRKLKEGKQLRRQLQGLGVLRQTGQDHFRGCVVVPVIGLPESCCEAQQGKVIQLYGRRIAVDSALKKGSPRHLYLPSALTGIWNEAALIGCDTVILCEALLDAMSFWCAGYRHVIAAFGVNGFTDGHLAALVHYQTKQVYIAYDNDTAGNQAADSLAQWLAGQGILALRIRFPAGLDANAFVVGSGNPGKSLALLLEQAQLMVTEQRVAVDNSQINADDATSLVASAEVVLPVLQSAPTEQGTPSLPFDYQQLNNGELLVHFGPRDWRIRGRDKRRDSMKIQAQVRERDSGRFHVDQLELYHAKARSQFIRTAAGELALDEAVIKRDLGQILLLLERLQEDELQAVVQAQQGTQVSLTQREQEEALALLQCPDLSARISADLAACGVIGEQTNLLAAYLAAVSRKLEKPLAVLIQSASAAGKSSLMEAVLAMIPPEERVQYSAMTGQSLFYLGETNLQHKILAIAEEEGVRQAAYALKLLQSDGELTMASTGKDEQSGELVTKEYHVKGPVMLMLTTTAIDIDEELLNRCLVLTVNESREQTAAIHALQRRQQTLDGLLAGSEKAYLTGLHQNAQRLLRPLNVVNPYAQQLTFQSDKTRTRRDHMKYLTLIQSITLLHQYQREIKHITHRGERLAYIEVSLADIALANQLAHAILGRTLDEMPPQTRKLLILLQAWAEGECQRLALKREELRFSRRDVRAFTQWGDTQLKVHLGRLVEMEYLVLYRKGLAYEYSLLYDGVDNGEQHLCGLLEVSALTERTSAAPDKAGGEYRSGLSSFQSAPGRPLVAGPSEEAEVPAGQALSGLSTKSVGNAGNSIISGYSSASADLPSERVQ